VACYYWFNGLFLIPRGGGTISWYGLYQPARHIPRSVREIANYFDISESQVIFGLSEIGYQPENTSQQLDWLTAWKIRDYLAVKFRMNQPISGMVPKKGGNMTDALTGVEALSEGGDVILLNKVGFGGLSEVFRGFDKGSEKIVAVKVIKEMGDGLSQALWKKEILSLSKLTHPNIVRILGSDSKPKGEIVEYRIVLEWLEDSLAERYARGNYTFEPASWLKYARGLIEGLSHAHQNNVAHRDIKPDNLLFRHKDYEDRQVIIADFGISKNTDNESNPRTVADFGSMVFSPPDHASRDPFSRDVYSIAAVLVQLTCNVLLRDTLDLQRALETSVLPPEFNLLLRNSIDLDPEKRPKNLIDFKVRFDALTEPYMRKQNAEEAPALAVSVKFTNAALNQLLNDLMPDFGKAKAKFEGLLSQGGLYSQLLPVRKELDDASRRVSVCSEDWVFTFVLRRDADVAPYLLLVAASEPDFDTLERYKFGSKSIGAAYRFVALEPRQSVASGRGLDALEAELSRHSPVAAEATSEPGSFESWSRVLDAREDLVRGHFKPLDFSSVRVEGSNAVFTLNSEIEAEIADTSWEIKDFRGVYFEVTSFDGTTLWTRPSRDVGTLVQRGQLQPSLGRDASSLGRQRAAVLSFKSGDAASKEIGAAVEHPESATGVNSVAEIVPVMSGLDTDKIEAVRAALGTDDLFVVEGPPGTGKTNFIAELVHQIKKSNPQAKILLVAQTHVALDNAILRLEKSGFKDMSRIGDPSDPRIHEDALQYLVDRKIKEWIEKIRFSAESDLKTRAGIEGQGLEKLMALSLLSELNAARKQAAYLEIKAKLTTTAFEESVSDEEGTRFESAISANETWRQGLRNKLGLLSTNVAKMELALSDEELDEKVKELVSQFPNPGLLLKLLEVQTGWLLKVHTDVDLRLRFLSSSGLVAGTCIGFLREPAVRDMEFDFCIVDEASKATATETLVPMSKAHRVVLVGDSNQLPPNDEELLENHQIMTNHGLLEAEVRTTLFDLLKNRLPSSKTVTLATQWRMSKPIGDLISTCFYEGKLHSVNDGQIQGYSNLIGKQVRWLDTAEHPMRMEFESKGGGYTNPVEARTIANEVVKIAKAVTSRHLKVALEDFEILIVSPYRAQKRTITNELQVRDYGDIRVRVETADAVQGSEADIVIVATTRSNNRGKLGFLGNLHWRRINVALSRAKFGLIVVGDATFIGSTQGGLSRALDYIKANRDTCSLEKVADSV